MCSLHVLFSWFGASFIRVSSFISLILFAWSILFFFIIYCIGTLPVSFRRIVVGVPLGRYRRVLITSLKILWSLLFSSFMVFQPSHAYVIVGMTMASTICQIAYIFIPLNSLFPVSAIMLAMAPFTFLSISLMWSARVPLLFMVSPRYLHVGTSSRVSPFSVRELFFPLPLFITLHLAAPNWMWYSFATWLVMFSISCSLSGLWWIRHTSSIHSRESRVIFVWVSYPSLLCFSSLAISSMKVAYSIMERTPPCLILSLILIFLVSPYLVWILAVRLELRFLIILKFLPSTPFWYRAYSIASSHALSNAF